MIADAGADAIGLNLFEKSSRFVSHVDASFICRDAPGIKRVGVFVNADVDEVRQTAEQLMLDYVQLHGDESLDYIRLLKDVRIIRALRMKHGETAEICRQIEQLQQEPNVVAILLDAFDKEHYGGTGKQVDWQNVAELDCFEKLPLILAGGLTPEFVADAIKTTRPAAIDVASGVESKAGVKDPELVKQFVQRAITAFKD